MKKLCTKYQPCEVQLLKFDNILISPLSVLKLLIYKYNLLLFKTISVQELLKNIQPFLVYVKKPTSIAYNISTTQKNKALFAVPKRSKS